MSTYVFSDVHGHSAALARLIDRVNPQPTDHFFCLGDMIDRGPDPVGVMYLTRSLPNARVLMGNHEELMIESIDNPANGEAVVTWGLNGGGITADELDSLPPDMREELVDWVRHLPRWAYVRLGSRLYLLCHAGLDLCVPAPEVWDDAGIRAFFAAQDPDDLLWIREGFWSAPTGLAGADGLGPVVVCGHTPTLYLSHMEACLDRPPLDENDRAQMVRVGAAADRWDIDSAAAAGWPCGQVMMLRLDDGAEFYEPVGEDE